MAFVKKHLIEIILGVSIALFVIAFSFLSIKRYLTLNSYYYDLGIMNQVVDNTSRGHFLEMTNQQLGKNASRIAIHFDPILAFFAPFYLVYRDPSVLLIGQAAIIGLGALAIYLLGIKVLKKKGLSLVFAVLYLLYFQVQRTVLFDFHAVALSTSFLLFAFYYLEEKKPLPYFAFIFLSLITKEHVGLIVLMLGLYILFIKKNTRLGLATLGIGALFFAATVYVLIPWARGSDHFALKYFADFGDSPSKILVNVLTHPLVTMRKIFSAETITYVSRLVVPMFFSLFSPFTFLIALPEWAINILSINANMRGYYFHYSSLIVPVLFYGAVMGHRNFDRLIKNKNIKSAVFAVFLLANAYSIYRYNPVPKLWVKEPVNYREIDPIKKKTINFLRERLKDEDIKLSTTPRLAPFFTNRRYYHNFLFDTAYAQMGQTDEDVIKGKLGTYQSYDYVIIDKEEIGDIDSGKLPVKFYQNLRENENYQMVLADDHDIEVYKKKDNKKSLIKDGEI
jgi:uncharacterized membrane protein